MFGGSRPRHYAAGRFYRAMRRFEGTVCVPRGSYAALGVGQHVLFRRKLRGFVSIGVHCGVSSPHERIGSFGVAFEVVTAC